MNANAGSKGLGLIVTRSYVVKYGRDFIFESDEFFECLDYVKRIKRARGGVQKFAQVYRTRDGELLSTQTKHVGLPFFRELGLPK
jgi:hypothetical protein